MFEKNKIRKMAMSALYNKYYIYYINYLAHMNYVIKKKKKTVPIFVKFIIV